MQEAGDLRRVALKVQLDEHGGVGKPLDGLLHAVPDQGLCSLGADLDHVQAAPRGAQSVERGHRHLDRLGPMRVRPAFQR